MNYFPRFDSSLAACNHSIVIVFDHTFQNILENIEKKAFENRSNNNLGSRALEKSFAIETTIFSVSGLQIELRLPQKLVAF
jgi:hypothetical protein